MQMRGWRTVCLSLFLALAPGLARAVSPQAEAQAATRALVREEKEQLIVQSGGEQSGMVRSLSAGKIYLMPYNPASNATIFLLPVNTPIYADDEKTTRDVIVPGASLRVYFRESPTANQPARAIAIELLSVDEAAVAKKQALDAPPVMVQGLAPIPPVPPPSREALLAKSSGWEVGRITALQHETISLQPPDAEAERLTLDPYVDVYAGIDRVGTDLLIPGVDVRAYYEFDPKTNRKKVIAIDLLNRRQALRRIQEIQPPKETEGEP